MNLKLYHVLVGYVVIVGAVVGLVVYAVAHFVAKYW